MSFNISKGLYTLGLRLYMSIAGNENKPLIAAQPHGPTAHELGCLYLSFLEKKLGLVGFSFSSFFLRLNRTRCRHSIYVIGHLLSQSQVYALSISRKFG